MEFAGDMPQSRFLRGDQFLRQVAALLGKFCQACKNLAVAANQIQACEQNGDEGGGQKNIELALHTIVNLRDACGSLLLAFIVPNKQPRNSGAEGLLPRLKRQANLFSRFRILAVLSKSEHPVYGVPK